ncbi:hypothetical protein GUJ93_ZPchr0003g16922 [Zizania palustris]|uniref:Uncharacterized protein n=1 Tax=Zizania palustris TaxID=103762 RepID=A0A8J5RM94_ZIZPA|nr:hypothetical protein GUJ93_ZPchr0003g16922 [Zizania palustris]
MPILPFCTVYLPPPLSSSRLLLEDLLDVVASGADQREHHQLPHFTSAYPIQHLVRVAHRPLRPRVNFSQPVPHVHRLPPPWALQKSVLPWALLLQLSTLHRLPPPCFTQQSVRPWALLVQSATEQRFPPPCATQYSVPPCTLFG